VVATTVPAVLISLRQRLGEADRERIAAFHNRLAMPIGSLPGDVPPARVARDVGMSPFRVVGICVLLIGGMMVAITPWVAEGVQRTLNGALAGILLLSGGLLARRSRAVVRNAARPEFTKAQV
jgi:hypothetical protein